MLAWTVTTVAKLDSNCVHLCNLLFGLEFCVSGADGTITIIGLPGNFFGFSCMKVGPIGSQDRLSKENKLSLLRTPNLPVEFGPYIILSTNVGSLDFKV